MSGFRLKRLGVVRDPELGNPLEAEGVLNPAVIRGPDGQLYLFPRLVAQGNYSRLGIARVRFDETGDPTSVERLGIAAEPEADCERCQMAQAAVRMAHHVCRATPPLHDDVYGAFSQGTTNSASRIGEFVQLAAPGTCELSFVPRYTVRWRGKQGRQRLPRAIPEPSGQLAVAILHRPLFPGSRPEETACHPTSRTVDLHRESIWIWYCSTRMEDCEPHHLWHFGSHHRLAAPVAPWERLKIGGGTPPVMTKQRFAYYFIMGSAKPHRPNCATPLE
jgi:beta-1,2-mannobiose phosphorylase / 1,2-beta-oligomannan phosphorylase